MLKKLLVLAAALAAVCCMTLSAGAQETAVCVQLDGQTLTFTDAHPQVKDNRTFLPYRAVFEAMGAQVDYEGNTVTAVRGDTLLTMTIGSTEATVTDGGVTTVITMDVAPYVDSTTWRTYVPVRFAADAFGCNVGWDQAAMTAVIVDTERVSAKLLEGRSFTLLEQLAGLQRKYETGRWAVNGSMAADVSLLGSTPFPILSGTVTGLTAEASAVETAVTMELDMTALMSHLAALSGSTLADMGVSEEQLRLEVDTQIRGDVNSGLLYLSADAVTAAGLGVAPGTWLAMDLNAMTGASGMSMAQLMSFSRDISLSDLTELAVALFPLDNRAEDGYTKLMTAMETALSALCDDGFAKIPGGYRTALDFPIADGSVQAVLDLTASATGSVNGYVCTIALSVPLDEATRAHLAQSGLPMDAISLSVRTALDANDRTQTHFSLSAGALLDLNVTVDADYDPTDRTPRTAPPAGAVTADYLQLLESMAGETSAL